MSNSGDLFSINALRSCWENVRRKGSAGGLDRQSLEQYGASLENNLTRLAEQLRGQRYIPDPGKRILLPKGQNEKRPISLVTVEDKIVQLAVKRHIEPRFEKIFADVSYAYRPGKGHRKAIGRVLHNTAGNPWVTTCDIDNFFDSIDHNILLQKIVALVPEPYLQELLRMWLKIGSFLGDRHIEAKRGIPQGGIISPLLSNLYLHDFDIAISKQTSRYVRYADDFIILAAERQKAEELHQIAAHYLQQHLQLKLNTPEKTVFELAEGFDFLGIRFLPDRREMAPGKVTKALAKIDRLFSKSDRVPLPVFVDQLNESVRSWKYYYQDCRHDVAFRTIQSKIFQRFSAHFRRLRSNMRGTDREAALRQLGRLQLLTGIEPAPLHAIQVAVFAGERRLPLPWLKQAPPKKTGPPGSEEPAAKPEEQPAAVTETTSLRKVKSRVRKFERQFADDYDLVLSDYGAFLGKRSGQFMIRRGNGKEKRIAASTVKHILVLSPSVTLSSAAVYLSAQENIPIDFIDYSGKPFARLAAPDQPAWRFGRYQLEAQSNQRGAALAKAFVEGKIRNQLNLLKYYAKYHHDEDRGFAAVFDRESAHLENYLDEARQLPPPETLELLRGQLFGIEGRAGSAYWRVIRALLPEDVAFPKRERRYAKDLVNVCLNYGYGVLYSRVWGALMRSGLNVQLSFLHAPQYQKPTLVYDLIEEFRAPVVDRVVISTLNRREALAVDSQGRLNDKARKILLENLFERLHTRVRYAGQRRALQDIIVLQAGRMGEYLKGERRSYQPFVSKW